MIETIMKSRIFGILVALTVAASPAAAQTTLVPSDVLAEARSLGAKGASAYCPSNPNYWRGSLGSLASKRPPDRLVGLNSRMDNFESLGAARLLDDVANVSSAAAAHVMVTGNSRVADQFLGLLSRWAKSGTELCFLAYHFRARMCPVSRKSPKKEKLCDC